MDNSPDNPEEKMATRKIKISPWVNTLLTLCAILISATVLYLYISGYRVKTDEDKIDLTQTGMVSAKSIPEGASVYLDDILLTATDDAISGINPGKHNLKIAKKGYVEWTKEIEVFVDLVTDITAVLVSQTTRLEPLTNTGARFPSMSPSLTKVAYFSTDPADPGVVIIPLAQSGLNIFKGGVTTTIEDTIRTKYSEGNAISWSPDEKTILITNDLSEGQVPNHYLIDLAADTIETTESMAAVEEDWAAKIENKRLTFLEKTEIPEQLKPLAVSNKSLWAPDDKKFLYTIQSGDDLEYHVYNLEKPLPIGEEIDNLTFTTNIKGPQPKVSWYADSFHLILVEGDVETNRQGAISLIRIDGSNKIEVYSNTLYSDRVFSSPNGEKLIILTSLKSGDQTDLYTIGIR